MFGTNLDAHITIVANKYGISRDTAIRRLLEAAVCIDRDMDVDGREVQTKMHRDTFRRWDWKLYMNARRWR